MKRNSQQQRTPSINVIFYTFIAWVIMCIITAVIAAPTYSKIKTNNYDITKIEISNTVKTSYIITSMLNLILIIMIIIRAFSPGCN